MSDLDDTLLAISGYYEAERDREKVLRRLANFCIAPYAPKDYKIERDWPIWGDEELRVEKDRQSRLLARLQKHKNALLDNGEKPKHTS